MFPIVTESALLTFLCCANCTFSKRGVTCVGQDLQGLGGYKLTRPKAEFSIRSQLENKGTRIKNKLRKNVEIETE